MRVKRIGKRGWNEAIEREGEREGERERGYIALRFTLHYALSLNHSLTCVFAYSDGWGWGWG